MDIGDKVFHPGYGNGIIQFVYGPEKISVKFEERDAPITVTPKFLGIIGDINETDAIPDANETGILPTAKPAKIEERISAEVIIPEKKKLTFSTPEKNDFEDKFHNKDLPQEDNSNINYDKIREIIREELDERLGIAPIELGGKWQGGKVVLYPKDETLKPKEITIESLFHKIVMIRDRLRVLEQNINSNNKLIDEEKVDLQQYITRCYGSLTTFNILFKNKEDYFVGQKTE